MAADGGRRPFLLTAAEVGPFCLVRLRGSGRASARSVGQLPLELSLVDGVEVIRDLPHVFDREIPTAPRHADSSGTAQPGCAVLRSDLACRARYRPHLTGALTPRLHGCPVAHPPRPPEALNRSAFPFWCGGDKD